MATVVTAIGLGIASFVIPLLFLIWIRTREEEGRERIGHVVKAFAYGAILGVLVAVVALGLAISLLTPALLALPGPGSAEIWLTIFLAPLIEEPAKGVWLLVARKRMDEPEDGLIYGAATGLGFGATENLGYVLAALFTGGLGFAVLTLLLRSVGTVLLHGGVTALVGYGLSNRRNPGRTVAGAIPWLLAAMVIHGVFNAIASLSGPTLGLAAILGAAIFFGWVAVRIARLDRRGFAG